MSKVVLVARILLGAAFIVFGLNGFLHFYNPPMPEAPEVLAALKGYSFIFPLTSLTEIVAALLILSGRFTPVGLLLLSPVLVNILAFHVALDMKGIGMGAFLSLIAVFLFWAYRATFLKLLDPAPVDAPAATGVPTTK